MGLSGLFALGLVSLPTTRVSRSNFDGIYPWFLIFVVHEKRTLVNKMAT